METASVLPDDADWKNLYLAGAAATLIMLALMPVQIVIYLLWPPPQSHSATEWFRLFQDNWLLGLVSLDLLYLLTNALLIPLYLAIFIALRRASRSFGLLALTIGLVGLAAYFSSNTAFEMLALSNSHASATTDAERAAFLAAGQTMLATYTGTAFDVYYVFNAIALLIFAAVMLRTDVFSNAAAYAGLAAAFFMAIPSSAGTIGLTFAFASLVPWTLFSILIARRLYQLGQRDRLPEREGM